MLGLLEGNNDETIKRVRIAVYCIVWGMAVLMNRCRTNIDMKARRHVMYYQA